jgi:hypothetical protein
MNDRNNNLITRDFRLEKFVYKENVVLADCRDGKIVVLMMIE